MFNGFSKKVLFCKSVCFLGAFYLQNDNHRSKKPVNDNFMPVCFIYSEKNSSLYAYSGLYAYNFLRKYPPCKYAYLEQLSIRNTRVLILN